LRGPPPAGGDRSAKGDQPRTSRTEPLEVQGYYAFYIFAMTPRDMEKLELEIMSAVRGTPTPHPKSPKGTLLSILCRNPDEPPSKQPLILVDSEVCFGTSQQDAINRLNASFGSPANLELYKSHSQNFVQYVFIPDV
jgi:hypothetical protein